MRLWHVEDSERFSPLAIQLWNYLLSRKMNYNFRWVHNLAIHDVKPSDLVYSKWLLEPNLPGIKIGPPPKIARMWNDKCYQYETLRSVAPIPQFRSYRNVFDFLREVHPFNEPYFLTCGNSDGGSHCMVVNGATALAEIWKMAGDRVNDSIRTSVWFRAQREVSFHVVIASRHQIFICEPVEQFNDFEDLVSFKGVKFPAEITDTMKSRLRKIITRIGRKMYESGYRGVCGMDFMINNVSEIYLVEINPRKMGSAVCDSVMLELKYDISLPVLEYHAVMNNKLPLLHFERDISDYKWSMEMFDAEDWSGPIDRPGDEIGYLRMKKDFTVNYYDKYYDDTKIFCIKGGTHVDE